MIETVNAWWSAWLTWFSGNEVPSDTYLGWWTLLTWGRIGKIISFAAGATVLLDLVGPTRLQQFGQDVRASKAAAFGRSRRFRSQATVLIVAGSTLGIAIATATVAFDPSEGLGSVIALWIGVGGITAVGLYVGLILWIAYTLPWLTMLVASIFDHPQPGNPLRWFALVVLVVGFHLDLLAS